MTHKERSKTLSVCLTAPRRLPPHPAQAGGNIGGSPIPRGSVSNLDPLGPAPSVEGAHNPVRDEPAAARINVLIAKLTLVKRVKPLRNDKVQFILGPRHCDIQQPPFFFDLFRGTGCQVRRNAAIDDVQDPDDPPFLPLGRMNGGQDRVIVVEGICASPATRRVRRIEGQLSEKPVGRL
jgi:hypothetical protein